MDTPQTRADRWAPYVAGALFALPVLIAKFPPMDDMPLHEASIGLWRHWSDAHFAPRGLYFLNLGHPNQLFSLLVYLLAFVVPIGTASKIVVASTLFALPICAAHFADYVGSPRWTALVSATVGLGWLFFWGLIQNIIGLAALLALLPPVDRFAARPTTKGAARICAAMLFLYFAHQAVQLVALLALFLCSIGVNAPVEGRLRRFVLRALPLVFFLGLALAANRYSWRISGPRLRNAPFVVYYSLQHKVSTIPAVLFGGYEEYVRNLMMLLACVPLALLGVARWRARPRNQRSLVERIHARRFDYMVLGLFIAYLALPANFQSTTLVYHRFLPTAWVVFAVCAGIGTGAARLPLKVLCGVVPLASVLISWPVFADSHRVYSDLEPLLDQIEIGSTVMTLNFGPQAPHRLWSPVVCDGHIVAVRGGRAMYDYTTSPISPVTQRADKQWTDAINRLSDNARMLRPDWDFTRFRYVLVNTTSPGVGEVVAMALKDAATLKARSGSWYLFESRLPLVPIDADDATLPEPHPATLRRKLRELAAQLDASESETPTPHGQPE